MVYLQQALLFVVILLSVAFFSLMERKVMASVQLREGPNNVGIWGVVQPFADAIKLILNVEGSPLSAVPLIYFFSPVFFFVISIMGWLVYSSEWVVINFPMGMCFVLVCYSLTTYGIVFSGWFSNSNYATLGCGRALTQSISYEVGLSTVLIMLCSFFCSSSLEFFQFLQREVKLIVPFFFLFVLLLILIISELNRSPFDLAEGESELVSGYSVEYGGLGYTLIFLSENASLLWGCYLMSLLFISELIWCLIVLVVIIRASLPRIRFDKIMSLFWVKVLPLVMVVVALIVQVL